MAGDGGWEKPRLEPRRAESRAPAEGLGHEMGSNILGVPDCAGKEAGLEEVVWNWQHGALARWDP